MAEESGDGKKRDETGWLAGHETHWMIVVALVLAGWTLAFAIRVHDWPLAQLASIAVVGLVFAGLVLLRVFFTKATADRPNEASAGTTEQAKREREQDRSRSKWLARLVQGAGAGMAVIVLYSIQYNHWVLASVVSTASVGLIAAGAGWFAGALLGFLFGIPHTRPGAPAAREQSGEASQGTSPSGSTANQDHRYEPSTSLEQISDWLTKIIVGVGLTQLNQVPGKLDALAAYVAVGMGCPDTSKPFALGIIIYFSVDGFLFGFLWARLDLMQAFRAADETLERVKEISSQIENDVKARNLVEGQLDLDVEPVDEADLKNAIAKASLITRGEIFLRAKAARSADLVTDAVRMRVIPIFRALIQADTKDWYHSNHAQLGYVLQEIPKKDWVESKAQLTKAIEIRDRRKLPGRARYELMKAIASIHIEGDPSLPGPPSDPAVRDRIFADLRVAFRDARRREEILINGDIQTWLAKNQLKSENL